MIVTTVEVRVLHQVKFVDRIDLLTAGDRGRGGRGSAAATADVSVMVVMVAVHVLVVGTAVVVLHGQVQRHGVRTDFVRRRSAAVHRHVRTAETVNRMVAGVRTCVRSKNKKTYQKYEYHVILSIIFFFFRGWDDFQDF